MTKKNVNQIYPHENTTMVKANILLSQNEPSKVTNIHACLHTQGFNNQKQTN